MSEPPRPLGYAKPPHFGEKPTNRVMVAVCCVLLLAFPLALAAVAWLFIAGYFGQGS